MNDAADATPRTLVGVSFPDLYRAREFLTVSERLHHDGVFVREDAVVVVKDDSGSTKVHETTDLAPGRTALSVGMWAGLFGLILGGPVGWLAGGALGAGAGAVTAKLVDLGISDEWVDWFQAAVEPGRAVVALLVTDLDVDALVDEVGRFHGAELLYANLPDDAVARLHEALGDLDHADATVPVPDDTPPAGAGAAPEPPPDEEPPASPPV